MIKKCFFQKNYGLNWIVCQVKGEQFIYVVCDGEDKRGYRVPGVGSALDMGHVSGNPKHGFIQ